MSAFYDGLHNAPGTHPTIAINTPIKYVFYKVDLSHDYVPIQKQRKPTFKPNVKKGKVERW